MIPALSERGPAVVEQSIPDSGQALAARTAAAEPGPRRRVPGSRKPEQEPHRRDMDSTACKNKGKAHQCPLRFAHRHLPWPEAVPEKPVSLKLQVVFRSLSASFKVDTFHVIPFCSWHHLIGIKFKMPAIYLYEIGCISEMKRRAAKNKIIAGRTRVFSSCLICFLFASCRSD